jgi:hypothetical protein
MAKTLAKQNRKRVSVTESALLAISQTKKILIYHGVD